jgi:AcrR family transcriptional regulator
MAVDRKAEILEVAAALFQRQGYQMTTMQQIADEIGILKGSLYHHYRSKQEILFAMSRDPLRQLADNGRRIAASRRPALDKVQALLRDHVEALAESYPHLMVVTAERDDSLPPEIREELVGLRHEYQRSWERTIRQGLRDGTVKSEFPPTVLVNFVLGSVNWMYRWYDPEGSLPAERLAELLYELVTRGIAS